MFKSKISTKLSLYFTMALLIFSLIIGSVFMLLFKNYTINLHKQDLEKRATSIANTLSNYMVNFSQAGNVGGFGGYLRSIGDIAGSDVWIVNENLELITMGRRMNSSLNSFNYTDLPENAEKVINEVFTNKTAFSEDFSGVLSEPTLTVGVPIKKYDKIIGVVLLHSPIHGTDQAIKNGFLMLGASILIAFIISIFLATGLSYKFTKPLRKMNNTALLLADGDYTAKTNIKQSDEIGELAETIDTLSEKLDEANKESIRFEQLRRNFFANVSHELRTPITVLRGSLEALTDKVVTDPKTVDEFHYQMLNETKFMQRLVGDLLELSRLQNENFKIEYNHIFFAELIDDVIRSANQIASKKNILIKLNNANPTFEFNGDYARLRQMLMIILDNAIKFTPENGTIEFVFKQNQLYIKDSGPGIPKKDLPYIFDRFYKSRSEQNKTGTGLGLALAKQIAERHNIQLVAESVEGNGAKFIFNFL